MITFDDAFTRLLGNEGGYVNDPRDPGGETNWGISKRSYPTVDIKNLTRTQAEDIYMHDFWEPLVALFGAAAALLDEVHRVAHNGGRLGLSGSQTIGICSGGQLMNWLDTLKTLAPTVASALGGPLAGAAVSALGSVFGVSEPTQATIAKLFQDGQLSAEQLGQIRQLEMQYQNEERERGFKYAELEFKDRDSARSMAVATHSATPSILTWIIVVLTLAAEAMLLFKQVPPGADPIIVGRVLGTMDSALVMVLSFWFGSNSSSQQKTALLAAANPVK